MSIRETVIRNKKIVIGAVIIIAAAGFLTFLLARSQEAVKPTIPNMTEGETEFNSATQTPNIVKEEVDTKNLPEALPSDLPLEAEAEVKENSVVSSPDKPGVTQYTRKYTSQKSLDENYEIYKDYLQKNGWNILTSIEEDGLRSLIAANADNSKQMFVTISENSLTGEVTVDVTIVTEE